MSHPTAFYPASAAAPSWEDQIMASLARAQRTVHLLHADLTEQQNEEAFYRQFEVCLDEALQALEQEEAEEKAWHAKEDARLRTTILEATRELEALRTGAQPPDDARQKTLGFEAALAIHQLARHREEAPDTYQASLHFLYELASNPNNLGAARFRLYAATVAHKFTAH